MDVTIYTDGGADPNPGYGGWGALLISGAHEKELSGGAANTTNNRMELQAAISALEALKRPCNVALYTDSRYLQQGISEWIEGWAASGWKRKGKPIPNADLWQQLWPLTKRHDIDWQWVKGHAGNAFNERVDRLATAARLAITPTDDLDENEARLFVRASYRGKTGHGGWAAIIEVEEEAAQFRGTIRETTNNRLEIIAVLEGLAQLPVEQPVQIVTVSDYVYQGATQWIHGWKKRGWKKKDDAPVSNADLWRRLDSEQARRQIRWLNAKHLREAYPSIKHAEKMAKEAARIDEV